jgi:hypothetical protein
LHGVTSIVMNDSKKNCILARGILCPCYVCIITRRCDHALKRGTLVIAYVYRIVETRAAIAASRKEYTLFSWITTRVIEPYYANTIGTTRTVTMITDICRL